MQTYTLRDMDNKINYTISTGGISARGVCKAIQAKAQYGVKYGDNTVYVWEEDVELALQMFPVAQVGGQRPATAAQINYLNILKVRVEPNMTVERASMLIDAAKAGILGSVNGFYTDGSN